MSWTLKPGVEALGAQSSTLTEKSYLPWPGTTQSSLLDTDAS